MLRYFLIIVFSMVGCSSSEESTERGPIEINQLWQAWESIGYHPDRAQRYRIGRGDRVGGVIVERFYKKNFVDTIHGEIRITYENVCDQYFCKESKSDTCFKYDYIEGVLIADSTLSYYFLALTNDDRPIWKLTSTSLQVRIGSDSYYLKPSHRVLADTSGGKLVIDWPKSAEKIGGINE